MRFVPLRPFVALSLVLLLPLVAAQEALPPRASVTIEGLPEGPAPTTLDGRFQQAFTVAFELGGVICPNTHNFPVALVAVATNTSEAGVDLTVTLDPPSLSFTVTQQNLLTTPHMDSSDAVTINITRGTFEGGSFNVTILLNATLAEGPQGCLPNPTGTYSKSDDGGSFGLQFLPTVPAPPTPEESPEMPGPGFGLVLVGLALAVTSWRPR